MQSVSYKTSGSLKPLALSCLAALEGLHLAWPDGVALDSGPYEISHLAATGRAAWRRHQNLSGLASS